jgi:hypothetical protein
MDTGHFVKVFDILDAGYRTGWFPAQGLIFIAIALLVVVFPMIVRALGIPHLNLPSWRYRLSALGIAVLWTTGAFWVTYSEYLHHRSLAQENGCRIVEGLVEHFVTTPSTFGGLAKETFSVSGVRFSYLDFALEDGFNDTSSNGGPIHAGSYVRICYDPGRYDPANSNPAKNVILRLEIRDFKGELKDYRRNYFPWSVDARNEKNRSLKEPWDVYLFYFAFILDVVAIHAMFLPYLRTFFRIKLTPMSDCPIPAALEWGKKTKLRKSMIYWDTSDRAIWLRPRGLILFEVPLQVAKLNIDESGTSIREIEIRLSSGLPIAIILILWAFYRSASVNVNGPPPILIVGIAAVIILINLWLWRPRPQMTMLVENALSELNGMRGPWERT